LNSVMIVLQRQNITINEVRSLFAETLKKYPKTKGYLKPDADIVLCPDFENALVHLQQGQPLSKTEEKAVQCLLVSETTEEKQQEEIMSFASRALATTTGKTSPHKYMSTLFIPPTTVCMESLFSCASHIWVDRRAAALPVHVEEQMFLYANRHLWDVQTVAKCVVKK